MGIKTASILTVLIFNSQAYAHGEEKRGPHGGFIRMPAAFHTEVVQKSGTQIRVYLLDINIQNPTVEASNVKAALSGGKGGDAKCEPQADFYLCTFADGSDLSRGELIIEAKRKGRAGSAVSYPLPLELQKPKTKN